VVRRRNVVDVELLDVVGMFENRRQLWGEALEFLIGEFEHGEISDLSHIIDAQHMRFVFRHRPKLSGPFDHGLPPALRLHAVRPRDPELV